MRETTVDGHQELTVALEMLLAGDGQESTSRDHLLWALDQMMTLIKPGDLSNQQLRALITVLTPAHARALVATRATREFLGAIPPPGRPALRLLPVIEPPA
jgi:hypothetical protein